MKEISLPQLFEIVCNHYGTMPEIVRSRSRRYRIVEPRQMFCYLAVEYWKYKNTLDDIGNECGICHATVIHHHKKIDGFLPYYGKYKGIIESILHDVKMRSHDIMSQCEKHMVSNAYLGRAYVNQMEVNF